MTSSCILKVSIAAEIRRLRTSLPTLQTVGSAAWLCALEAEVREGLCAGCRNPVALRYRAGDGELRLLTEARCEEFVSLASTSGQGDLLLRIFVQDSGALQSASAAASNASAHAEEQKAPRGQAIRQGVAASRGQVARALWASGDGKASVTFIDTPYRGRQPRLTLGKSSAAFLVHVKLGMMAEEVPFDGGPEHVAALEAALDAVRRLAPRMAQTPGWHSVVLEDGRSIALHLCLEYQLHLCLKHCPSQPNAGHS